MATSMDSKHLVTKLNGDNYFNWKLKIEMLMRERGIWKAISDKPPDPVTDEWTTIDEKARATIILLVEDDQLQHVRDSNTAAQAWNNLKEFYQKNTASTRVFLLRSIMRHRANDGDDIEQHVKSMTDLFQRLSAVGKEIKPDFFMAATLMGSLPSSYDNLITALEARDEDVLTPSYVRSKIIEEYKRRSTRDANISDENSVAAYSATNYRKNKKYCVYCRKPGHNIDECRRKAKKDASEPQAANLIEENDNKTYYCLSTSSRANGFVIDSGATCHFSGNKDQFASFDPNYHATITLPNGQTMNATGKGEIRIQVLNESNAVRNLRLCDVLYIPGMVH